MCECGGGLFLKLKTCLIAARNYEMFSMFYRIPSKTKYNVIVALLTFQNNRMKREHH